MIAMLSRKERVRQNVASFLDEFDGATLSDAYKSVSHHYQTYQSFRAAMRGVCRGKRGKRTIRWVRSGCCIGYVDLPAAWPGDVRFRVVEVDRKDAQSRRFRIMLLSDEVLTLEQARQALVIDAEVQNV